MRQGSWKCYLVVLAVCCSLAACDPYAYYPARSKPMTPPPAGAPAGGDAPAGQAAPAPAPAPSLDQQVQDLQARVQQLETRLAEMEGQQPPPPAPSRREAERARYKAPGAPAGYPAPSKGQEKLYVDGYRFYQKKKYAPARNLFAKYLKAQPRGSKAPEARYYLAFCFQH
ncbi:MAG: hypothetical protein PHU44_02145, partial [Syntrophales bacterium]|nr:hypothetical protein [Syntrophales bacterium]